MCVLVINLDCVAFWHNSSTNPGCQGYVANTFTHRATYYLSETAPPFAAQVSSDLQARTTMTGLYSAGHCSC